MENPILFDLDGTLWDSVQYHTDAWKQIFERRGLVPPSDEWLLGRPTSEVTSCLRDLVPGISSSEIRAEKSSLFSSLVRTRKPRLFWQLADFESLGTCIGIVTGASHDTVTTYLNLLGGNPFKIIHTGDDSEVGKPHPRPFLDACARLGLHPSSVTAVEDSENGLTSASAAGCRLVHFDPNFSEKLTACWCSAFGARCVHDSGQLINSRGADPLS